MGIFTVEYVARLLTTPALGPFLTSFANFVDLVAIAPFYLELMITGSSTGAVVVFLMYLFPFIIYLLHLYTFLVHFLLFHLVSAGWCVVVDGVELAAHVCKILPDAKLLVPVHGEDLLGPAEAGEGGCVLSRR